MSRVSRLGLVLKLDALARRRAGAAEEVLMAALRESRRNLLGLQAAREALDDSIKREEMQARMRPSPPGAVARRFDSTVPADGRWPWK
jgi:hypothetical protein